MDLKDSLQGNMREIIGTLTLEKSTPTGIPSPTR